MSVFILIIGLAVRQRVADNGQIRRLAKINRGGKNALIKRAVYHISPILSNRREEAGGGWGGETKKKRGDNIIEADKGRIKPDVGEGGKEN